MQINKNELMLALETVKPGLASKEVISQATSFAFIKGRVTTYNDEISISHPIAGLNIEGAIKAEILYALLGKIKKDEIDISINENENEILIKAGKAKAGLTLISEITLPLDSIAEHGKWKSLPDNFIDALAFVVGSAGKDMSRPILTSVHVNKEGWIEASDANRISKYTISPMPISTVLIPATSCSAIIKLQPTKVAEGPGWVHFKTEEGTELSCRIFEDDVFPDVPGLFVVKGAGVTLPKKLEEVLSKATIFSKRDHALDEFITLDLKENSLKIRSNRETEGWFEEKLNIEYLGTPLHFSVSPYALKEILKESLSCVISEDKMKFEGENWVYVSSLTAEE